MQQEVKIEDRMLQKQLIVRHPPTPHVLSPQSSCTVYAGAMSIRLITPLPPSPARPNPICKLLDASHELADAVIDAEPGLRDIERLALRVGVALLHARLKPASCTAPS